MTLIWWMEIFKNWFNRVPAYEFGYLHYQTIT